MFIFAPDHGSVWKHVVRRKGKIKTWYNQFPWGEEMFLFPPYYLARKAPLPLPNIYNFCCFHHIGSDGGGRVHCFPLHHQCPNPIPSSAEDSYLNPAPSDSWLQPLPQPLPCPRPQPRPWTPPPLGLSVITPSPLVHLPPHLTVWCVKQVWVWLIGIRRGGGGG